MKKCKYLTPLNRCTRIITDIDLYRMFYCNRASDFLNCDKYVGNNKTTDGVPIKIRNRR